MTLHIFHRDSNRDSDDLGQETKQTARSARSASASILTFKGKSWALLEWKPFSNLLARGIETENMARWKDWELPVCLRTRTGLRSPKVWPTLCHWVCWGMCNYGGQAFDPAFPSGLNCPHIERCSVSLGTPLYSAGLSCAPLWNSKHPLLKSELWPAHAPVQDGGGRGGIG